MSTSTIVIATLQPAEGQFCGVQKHFQVIGNHARRHGARVQIVTPYDANLWLQRASNGVRRVLGVIDAEAETIWESTSLALRLYGELRKALRRLSSEQVTVYAQCLLSAGVALRLRDEGLQFRLVLVVHYNESEAKQFADNGQARVGGLLWRSYMALERRVLPNVDTLIFVSKYMRKVVEDRVPAIREVDVQVVHNFADVAPALPAAPRGDVIAVGTLEPRKNQSFLIEVLAAAAAAGKPYRLTLVGDGPSRRALEELAVRLGVREQVTFLGYVPDAASLVAEHRALVHAARIENLPLVLVEAMQQSVPIFAAAVGGIPEVFDDGVEGRFWPLDDPRSAAAILIDILESEPRRAAMAAAARRRYEREFSTAVLGRRWLEAICGP
jgi:glycosyltransferase involved in cell wall biosynthesis